MAMELQMAYSTLFSFFSFLLFLLPLILLLLLFVDRQLEYITDHQLPNGSTSVAVDPLTTIIHDRQQYSNSTLFLFKNYMHIYVYIYICIYIFTCAYVYICIYTCVYIYISPSMALLYAYLWLSV